VYCLHELMFQLLITNIRDFHCDTNYSHNITLFIYWAMERERSKTVFSVVNCGSLFVSYDVVLTLDHTKTFVPCQLR
jgi:hypothetical protein